MARRPVSPEAGAPSSSSPIIARASRLFRSPDIVAVVKVDAFIVAESIGWPTLDWITGAIEPLLIFTLLVVIGTALHSTRRRASGDLGHPIVPQPIPGRRAIPQDQGPPIVRESVETTFGVTIIIANCQTPPVHAPPFTEIPAVARIDRDAAHHAAAFEAPSDRRGRPKRTPVMVCRDRPASIEQPLDAVGSRLLQLGRLSWRCGDACHRQDKHCRKRSKVRGEAQQRHSIRRSRCSRFAILQSSIETCRDTLPESSYRSSI